MRTNFKLTPCCKRLTNAINRKRIIFYKGGNFAVQMPTGTVGLVMDKANVEPINYCPFCGKMLHVEIALPPKAMRLRK